MPRQQRSARRLAHRAAEPSPAPQLFRLGFDILVEVLSHLSIRDVLRLRQVCKRLCDLTRQPIVWKQFLYNFHLPLPPLPPTSRYSFPQLTAFETERLLLRAISADANWRSEFPTAYRYWSINIWSSVLEVKVLPGGKHLLLSVRNGTNRYELLLLMADHRTHAFYPVATCRVPTRAYKLEAKYMAYNGEVGIMIAYGRTEAAREKDRNNPDIDVSNYSENHTIDFPVPVRYELSVAHVKLSALETVEDPNLGPGTQEYFTYMKDNAPPLERVTAMQSSNAYDFFDIDELDGQPYLVCTQQRNITTKNLATKSISRFRCNVLHPLESNGDNNTPLRLLYHIRAIRILPPQRELLVVRTSDAARGLPMYLQLFRIPSDGEYPLLPGRPVPTVPPRSYAPYYLNAVFSDVQISPHGLPFSTDLPVPNPHAEPPPVSIFAASNPVYFPLVKRPKKNPFNIVELALLPERVPKLAVRQFPLGNNNLPPLPNGEPYPREADPHVFPGLLQDDNPTLPAARPDTSVLLSETTFRFNVLGRGRVQYSHFTFRTDDRQSMRYICGPTRSMIVGRVPGRSANPSYACMYAYSNPLVFNPGQWPQDAEFAAAAVREREWVQRAMPARQLTLAMVDTPVEDILHTATVKGLQAIAWDDWSGRVCLAKEDDPETLLVLEYAAAPLEGERLFRHRKVFAC
ncbi:hypothetical protein FA95DRAFT_1556760 [Auriscalpium vulgare]|uniref:Uncharacterized protein n=1 Tax=Auriscalpium vulgare TaxID=40419 RepID=A0ACB8S048_9AGAM|nr:hypothetical protein FA95DRAFT_1556760 [Auriscalpium vulgare]